MSAALVEIGEPIDYPDDPRLAEEQAELERWALEHQDELAAEATSTVQRRPAASDEGRVEEPRAWTISGTPDEINARAYDMRRERLRDSGVTVIGELPVPRATPPAQLTRLRVVERSMIEQRRPRARSSRVGRRANARAGPSRDDPSEPDPPLGGLKRLHRCARLRARLTRWAGVAFLLVGLGLARLARRVATACNRSVGS
jgi:hypothetical protein